MTTKLETVLLAIADLDVDDLPRDPETIRAFAKEHGLAKVSAKQIAEIAEAIGERLPADERTRSVVPLHYKKRYAAFGNSNGDDLASRIKEFVTMEDSNGYEKVSIAALRQLAEANGVDPDRWAERNPGMQRMNLGNVLRAKARKEGIDSIVFPTA